jgi:acyl-CoA thioesterase FadM
VARLTLELPEAYSFCTKLNVRVSDVNYANHLGNDAMVSLLHEARLGFLKTLGFTEANIAGLGLMVTDLAVVYKSEAFVGDQLSFHVGVSDFNKYGCDVIYKVVNEQADKLVAQAKTGVVFFDFDERKIAQVPKTFLSCFDK